MPPPNLILASSSPWRRSLLERLQTPFEHLSPDLDERPQPGETPERLAPRLALEKAERVFRRRPDAWVIGSDQVVVVGKGQHARQLGKPGHRRAAEAQLKALSGNEATFLTAVCLLTPDSGQRLETEVTRVRFRNLKASDIRHYLAREPAFDCAGGFRSEALGIALIERIEGADPNALIGLPLIRLCRMLREAGFDPLRPG